MTILIPENLPCVDVIHLRQFYPSLVDLETPEWVRIDWSNLVNVPYGQVFDVDGGDSWTESNDEVDGGTSV